jgi:hypothetical protein
MGGLVIWGVEAYMDGKIGHGVSGADWSDEIYVMIFSGIPTEFLDCKCTNHIDNASNKTSNASSPPSTMSSSSSTKYNDIPSFQH